MSDELVTTHEAEQPYLLLTPGYFPARVGSNYQRILDHQSNLRPALDHAWESKYVAVDFETTGNDFTLPEFQIAGIGLAWDKGSIYIHWTDLDHEHQILLIDFLMQHPRLLAHNVGFDGGVIYKYAGENAHWHACTYALTALLANEGYPGNEGRGWGLKYLQTHILGWADSNEHELDEWLVVNGHYKGNPLKDNSPASLRERYLQGKLKPDKGLMCLAPREILGKYCVLDAEACYLLYTEVLDPTSRKFPGLEKFFYAEFMPLILRLIWQRMLGIHLDRGGLEKMRVTSLEEVANIERDLRSHPEIQEHITDIERLMIEEKFCKEPVKLKKDGNVSKIWEKWIERRNRALAGEDEDTRFNFNSGPQMRDLLYSRLGLDIRILTDGDLPSVGTKAFRHMGDSGRVLSQRAYLLKKLSYVEKYLELTEKRPTIHPSFRTPGTTTGRLSSKDPNMQQVQKTDEMLSKWVARPGYMWVDLDFSALEPTVVAEFSQDPNMLQIYGNGVPANDIYLFVGAQLPGEIGEKIRSTGFDPYNPTPEALSRAKKECKHERGICKTVVLAAQYGAGVNKVKSVLEEQDIFLDYDEVKLIHSGYWEVFAKVKDFARGLQFQLKRNKGYILNGIGRPMAVPASMDRDVLNRFIQSTGHDILTIYINILCDMLTEEGLEWYPVILDFHDATTVEVPEKDAQKAVMVFNRAMDALNQRLQGTVKLKGVPTVGRNLSEVKEPEK